MTNRSRIVCRIFAGAVVAGLVGGSLVSLFAEEPAPPAASAPESAIPAAELPPTEPPAPGSGPEAPSHTSRLREAVEGAIGAPVRGSLSNRFRVRRAKNDATDEDLIQFVRVGVGNEATDRWTADVAARAQQDVDGDTNRTGFHPFGELSDTRNDNVTARLYTAHITGRNIGGLDQVRIGRQEFLGTDLFHFDGLRLDSQAWERLKNLQVTVFGGYPVYLYEADNANDGAGGVQVQVRPLPGATVTGNYAHLTDEFTLYGVSRTNIESIQWRQQITPNCSAMTRFVGVDGRGREAEVQATYRRAERDLLAQIGYRRLMEEQKAAAIGIEPYGGILNTLQPYHQVDARASKGVLPWLTVSLDGTVRTLADEDDQGEFNREFSRFSFIPVLSTWPTAGSEWTLTLTGWEAEGDRSLSYGGELAQPVGNGMLVRAGSDYSLYKFDLFSDEERTHARTFFLKLRWAQTKEVRWDVGVERERNDFDTFTKFEVAVQYRF